MKLRSFLLLGAVVLTGEVLAAPRLVLQLTVDQLRGDMLPASREKFSGGFDRLLKQGVVFTNAHYRTSNTFTASGHAVLSTGADTSEHGMVANEWWDRATGKLMYCTADGAHPVIGEPAKPGAGMSPANLSSTTLGDEIVSSRRGRAFAIAGKDRSSIIPGGHLGKAFWFSEKTGGFTSSTYYGEALPAWLVAWNQTKPVNAWRNQEWKPSREAATYRFASAAGNDMARPNATLGRSFPHPLVAASDAIFLTAFRFTPFLDELTEQMAKTLITSENLGREGTTDYLSISFSGHDYIGHSYGPNSMESEDSLLRLDRVLGDLFAFLDEKIGWQNIVVVLSADHGVDDIPEAAKARGFAADRIRPAELVSAGNAALRTALHIEADVIASFVPPGFYFDAAKLADAKVESRVAEDALATWLRTKPGIAAAVPRHDLLEGAVPRTALFDQLQRGFHPTRSGDVVIAQQQFWYLYPEPDTYAAMHGSPYAYDTFVPIIFAGANLRASTVTIEANPNGIAPTLAALVQVKPPSGSSGAVLEPVLDAAR